VLWLMGKTLDLMRRAARRPLMVPMCALFGSHGRRFRFDPWGRYCYPNIHVGDDVNLGYRPILLALHSEIRIGNHVMFGPRVVVIGGGHNTTVPGRFMSDVLEKTGNEDLGVTIEDDIWVGAGAVILRGVRVGRGSVIGAGSVVTKSVPPYAIVVGNPARLIRFRWDVDTIVRHEQSLYPPEERYTRAQLQKWQATGSMLAPARNGAAAGDESEGGAGQTWGGSPHASCACRGSARRFDAGAASPSRKPNA
jgi:acetyltransferase-like isoleucine patch superfamily enzyme